MKVVLVLALALAVANAAFTGSLVQQTKPLLNKAKMNMQLSLARNVRARSSAEAGFQTAIIEALHEQASQIVAQIEAAITTGQNIAAELVAAFNQVIADLSNLGSDAASGVQSIISQFVGNFWDLIFGGNKRSSIEITPEMAGIIQMVLSNPTFVSLFQSEPLYQCLKDKGITVDYEHLQALNAAGQLNPSLVNKPEVAECLVAVGGIQAVITGSATISFIQQLADQLGLKPLLHSVMNQLLGPELTAQIIALLNQRHRGFFDGLSNLWNVISEGASNAWDAISNGASNFVDYIANVISGIYDSAVDQFTQVQQIATMFIQGGIAYAQQLGVQGAQALLNFIAPYHSDLGVLYDQIVNELTAIYGNLLTLPIFGN